MTGLDWTNLMLGLALGAAIGSAHFAGLAIGIRIALRTRFPTAVLLTSAGLRIALVLAAGWQASQFGAEALAGFALAFFLARFAAITVARHHRTEPAKWN